MKLLSVDDARTRMLARAPSAAAETVPLEQALGRRLLTAIDAARDQPPFAASAMDGWAVRAADTPGLLRIVGESAAGHGFAGELGPGEAVRIFTGAAVPPGADAVILQEVAQREGDQVRMPAAGEPRHVRAPGQDFRAGDRLLDAGVRLDPWRLALAAAAGRAQVTVARRPRVAILSTGDEVIAPGATPGPFQIFNSGAPALSALANGWGAEAWALASVGDDLDATTQAVAAAGADLVVTLGGASVGDHDLVKPALAPLGLTLAVESVSVRPGKPTWFGVLASGVLVLGLPGNPASALVCAELFLRPLLTAMQGGDAAVRLIPARAGDRFEANGGREHWMRARLGHAQDGALVVNSFADQDSSLVTVFAGADVLVRRAPHAPAVEAGGLVEALLLNRLA